MDELIGSCRLEIWVVGALFKYEDWPKLKVFVMSLRFPSKIEVFPDR